MNNLEVQLPEETLDDYKGVYFVDDMNAARKYLIEATYRTRSRSKIELESKLKCGMLTSDVIDYFVYGKRDSIDEKIYSDNIEDGEEEDVNCYNLEEENYFEHIIKNSPINLFKTSSDKNTSISFPDQRLVEIKESPHDAERTIEKNAKFELDYDPLSHETRPKSKSPNSENLKKPLSHPSNMDHACKKRCLENIKKPDGDVSTMTRFGYKLVFVCDLCRAIFEKKEMALFHVNSYDHISASEFFIKKSALKDKKDSLESIVNRCSIKSSRKRRTGGVFCPNRMCSFYFEYSFLFYLNYSYLILDFFQIKF